MDEREWIRRLQRGDETAFEPLYRVYIDQAVRTAYLVTRNQQAAEDAAQETFVQVLRRVGALQDPTRFRSWFYSILLNTARRTGRKGRGWRFLPLYRLPDTPQPGEAPPDEQVIAREEIRTLIAGLAELPDRHRVPVILRYYLEMTEPEIAQTLHLPLGTVKSRLHHARVRLGRLLEDPRIPGGNDRAER